MHKLFTNSKMSMNESLSNEWKQISTLEYMQVCVTSVLKRQNQTDNGFNYY